MDPTDKFTYPTELLDALPMWDPPKKRWPCPEEGDGWVTNGFWVARGTRSDAVPAKLALAPLVAKWEIVGPLELLEDRTIPTIEDNRPDCPECLGTGTCPRCDAECFRCWGDGKAGPDESESGQIVLRNPDGEEAWFDGRCMPLLQEGELVQVNRGEWSVGVVVNGELAAVVQRQRTWSMASWRRWCSVSGTTVDRGSDR